MKKLFALALLAAALPACSDTTGPHGTNRLAVRFAVSKSAARAAASSAGTAAGALTISGANGTLAIDDVRMIVSQLELRGVADSCATNSAGVRGGDGARGDGAERGGDRNGGDCGDVHAAPFLLSLPLDGSPVTVATTDLPAGTFSAVKFKVDDDLPEIGDDGATQQALGDILAQLRAAFPSFPQDASMVVHGTFTPAGGVAQEFTVFFRAKVEIEKPLDPPVTIPGASAITIDVDPTQFFKVGQNVIDLGALNGQTVDLEAEVEHGFEDAHGDR